ncbi:stem cell self-renewal protein Piwi [Haloferax denitrificans ATCC 35960]|uniref:Stem cell self-renewal protein Piwi n=1 Tax=Haloferax denitrificans ATCC 35960 TaxID=662478 RepID=M0JFY9_9EURY|nr:stem cell self-renewal protein Piwi [Haloferax denitrificans ATCC 35960]
MTNRSPQTNSRTPERQADINPGTYVLHGRGNRRLTDVKVNRYELRVDGGVENHWDSQSFTSSAAYYLDRTHGTPVASAGPLSVISVTGLSKPVNVWGKRVTPVKTETVQLDPKKKRDREHLRAFVQSCLRRAVPDDTYAYKFINDIVRNDPAFSTGTDGFAAHPKHEVKVQIASDGTVLAHVESGYSIKSKSTLDNLYSPGSQLPNMKVAHDTDRYAKEGQGWLKGWSEFNYTDYIRDVGSSIAELHEGTADEDWRQRLIEENPRLVKVKYGNMVGNQLPHFLRLSPRPEQVQRQDYDFFSQFISRRAMMPDEKYDYSKSFFESLSRLPVIDLEFEPGPTNHPYKRINVREQNTRLVFSDDQQSNTPSGGLREYGVYASPGRYRVGLLMPSQWEETLQKLTPLLVKGLNNIGAPAGVTGYHYGLGDISNYTPVAHEIRSETDAVVAVVPNKGAADDFGIDDPHHELKRTLMRKGIPTQMLQKSSAQELIKQRATPNNDKFLNILSAIVAKAGGTPWQVDSLPGETDAFMGLDVTRDSESGQHSGASASVVLADGTTFAAESTTQQGGEKFAARHVEQFVRDLVVDFAEGQEREINRVCIMRDGKVHEDIDAVREGLSELDAEIDIVGVRKRGQPRIADYNGTRFKIAYKGMAFVDADRDEAVIHGFGKPEIRDDNPVGTPQTFKLVRHSGPTDIETLARQAYWLSEVHVGSPAKSPRLPIPIEYADKAAEYVRKEYVSPGKVIKGPAYI